MIPPHILKIISEVSDFAGLYKAHYKAGAVFGYELREEEIKEKDDKIKQLEELLKEKQ